MPVTMNTNEGKELNSVKVAITTAGHTPSWPWSGAHTASLVGVAGTTVLAP